MLNGVSVSVRNNDIDRAIRNLKRKMKQEGVIKDMERITEYEKPSVKRRRVKAEAIRRERRRRQEAQAMDA